LNVNLNLTLTQTLTNPDPNPNPDPSRKSKNNVCSTKRHRIKFQHSVIIEVNIFLWNGGGFIKCL